MNANQIFTAIVLAFSLAVFAPAQETERLSMTVQEAVNYALAGSYQLKSDAIDAKIKKRSSDYAKNVFLPSVSVSAGVIRSNELGSEVVNMMDQTGSKAREGDKWMYSVPGINVSWAFNMSMLENIKIAHAEYEAQLITSEELKKQTELNVRKKFYALLVAQESLSLQEASLENAKDRAEQAQKNFQNGRISQLTLLQAQVAYSNQKPQVLSARQAIELDLDDFAFLLGLKAGTKIQVDGSMEVAYQEIDADNLLAKQINSRLDYQLLLKNKEALGLQKKALGMQSFLPTLQVDWNLQPVRSFSNKQWYADAAKGENGSLSVALVWSLSNLLPSSESRQRMQDATDNLDKLQIEIDALTEQAKNEVTSLSRTLALSRSQITALEANIELAQNAYDMILRSYQSGASELLDVRDAENSLNQAKYGLLSEQFAYLSALLDLEYALGVGLP
ncbi:hypothetical protein AGMMS49938_01970 [Fibrobacterales bacterium]|nr:hypothetical protein AGMMS49938_01970 [Fibrobacterales bacterium]